MKDIFNIGKMRILIELDINGVISFYLLKQKLSLSDGALSGHLKTLKKYDYVSTFFDENRQVTLIQITQKGIDILKIISDVYKPQIPSL